MLEASCSNLEVLIYMYALDGVVIPLYALHLMFSHITTTILIL